MVLETRATPAITIKGGFEGLTSDPPSGNTPPDTDVAVGPAAILETVNVSGTLRTKSGAVLSNIDFNTMFPPLTPNGSLFDPNICYDDNSQRFFIVIVEIDDIALTSFLHIAVSNTSTPTDFATDFTEQVTIDMVQVTPAGNILWADFPRIGYNADALFLTFNMFDFFAGYDHTLLLTFNKSTLLDANPATARFFPHDFTANEFTLVPASMHQAPAGAPGLFIGLDGISNNTLQYLTMTNYFSTVPVITTSRFAVAPFINGLTPDAIQPFTGVIPFLLTTNDSSILEAGWRNGRMAACGNVTVNNFTKVRWYEIDAPASGARPRLIQQGNIDPGIDVSTFLPAIDIAQNLDIGISYMQTSPNEFLSMYIAGRTQSDAKGTVQTPVRVREGEAVYTSFTARTGDFGGVAVDPLNPNTFVAAHEYATNLVPDTNWGTWISTFTLAGPTPSPLRGLNPLRWIYNRATDTYSGTLIIANAATTLTGNFTLVLTLPDPSVQVLTPAGTRIGNTYVIPITGPFVKNQPLRITIQIVNPLRFALGSIQLGLITSVS